MDKTPKPKEVALVRQETVYQGFFRLDRYHLRHALHEGGWSREISREIFERGHAVALLPYDPVRDEVVLIEQFRAGAYACGRDPWLIEIVAGMVESDETPQEVARRETREEADCQVSALEMITDYLVSPGGTSESVALFCGQVDAAKAGGIHGHDHEDEDIRVFALPFGEAYEMVGSGKIANSAAVIALLWLALNRERLRREWL